MVLQLSKPLNGIFIWLASCELDVSALRFRDLWKMWLARPANTTMIIQFVWSSDSHFTYLLELLMADQGWARSHPGDYAVPQPLCDTREILPHRARSLDTLSFVCDMSQVSVLRFRWCGLDLYYFIDWSWVLGFRSTFLLMKRFYSHPRFEFIVLNTTGVDRIPLLSLKCLPTSK